MSGLMGKCIHLQYLDKLVRFQVEKKKDKEGKDRNRVYMIENRVELKRQFENNSIV